MEKQFVFIFEIIRIKAKGSSAVINTESQTTCIAGGLRKAPKRGLG